MSNNDTSGSNHHAVNNSGGSSSGGSSSSGPANSNGEKGADDSTTKNSNLSIAQCPSIKAAAPETFAQSKHTHKDAHMLTSCSVYVCS